MMLRMTTGFTLGKGWEAGAVAVAVAVAQPIWKLPFLISYIGYYYNVSQLRFMSFLDRSFFKIAPRVVVSCGIICPRLVLFLPQQKSKRDWHEFYKVEDDHPFWTNSNLFDQRKVVDHNPILTNSNLFDKRKLVDDNPFLTKQI